jgi:hypothetical protein
MIFLMYKKRCVLHINRLSIVLILQCDYLSNRFGIKRVNTPVPF